MAEVKPTGVGKAVKGTVSEAPTRMVKKDKRRRAVKTQDLSTVLALQQIRITDDTVGTQVGHATH
jgi:hypothetical protein